MQNRTLSDYKDAEGGREDDGAGVAMTEPSDTRETCSVFLAQRRTFSQRHPLIKHQH